MISIQGMDAADPLRPVDWRARRARNLADSRRRPSSRHNDPVTLELARFYRRRDASSHQSAAGGQFDRAIACAVAIHADSDGLLRAILEARLLSGQSPEAIAVKQGIKVEAVAWYALAFFDVRDRLGNSDFIVGNVIGAMPARNDGNGIIEWCWLRAAYLGGIAELETVLAMGQQKADGTQLPWASRLAAAQSGMLRQIMTAASANVDPRDTRVRAQLVRAHLRKVSAEGADDTPYAILCKALDELFASLPLAVGGRGDKQPGPLAPYDQAGIELSSNEQLQLHLGKIPENLPALDGIRFPGPGSSSNTGAPS